MERGRVSTANQPADHHYQLQWAPRSHKHYGRTEQGLSGQYGLACEVTKTTLACVQFVVTMIPSCIAFIKNVKRSMCSSTSGFRSAFLSLMRENLVSQAQVVCAHASQTKGNAGVSLLLNSQTARCISKRICHGDFVCCQTETEAADQTCHLAQSRYTNTGPTSPNIDLITPGVRQGGDENTKFFGTGITGSPTPEADALTSRAHKDD